MDPGSLQALRFRTFPESPQRRSPRSLLLNCYFQLSAWIVSSLLVLHSSCQLDRLQLNPLIKLLCSTGALPFSMPWSICLHNLK